MHPHSRNRNRGRKLLGKRTIVSRMDKAPVTRQEQPQEQMHVPCVSNLSLMYIHIIQKRYSRRIQSRGQMMSSLYVIELTPIFCRKWKTPVNYLGSLFPTMLLSCYGKGSFHPMHTTFLMACRRCFFYWLSPARSPAMDTEESRLGRGRKPRARLR